MRLLHWDGTIVSTLVIRSTLNREISYSKMGRDLLTSEALGAVARFVGTATVLCKKEMGHLGSETTVIRGVLFRRLL